MRHPPIVIGGGIAGLTAALRLAQRGLNPILLEADAHSIGGRLRDEAPVTLTHHGREWHFPQEHGVHGIWEPYVNFKGLLEELDIAPAYRPAQDETWFLGQNGTVRHANIGRAIRHSFFPAPFHYLQLFGNLRFLKMLNLHDWVSLPRVMGGLFAAMSIDPLAEQKALTGLSLADMTSGWSQGMRNMFAGLARNALAGEPDEIPAAGWIAFLRFYTLMRREAWGFDYLPSGGGTAVCQPLAQKLIELGGTIEMGARVQQLLPAADPSDANWQISYEQQGRSHIRHTGDVILALDAPSAQTLLLASPDTAESAADLHFPQGIPTVIVRLWFKRQPQNSAEAGMLSGDFIFDNFFWLDKLQTAYQTWAQETGGSALEVHIYGAERGQLDDALLLAHVLRDVHRAFPDLRDQWLHLACQRNAPTHTLFSVGEAHLGIRTPWPHLYACGDWVYHENPALYLERAVTTGMLAANALLEENGREPHQIHPHPPPEPIAQRIAQGWGKWRKRRLAQKG